MFQLEVDATLDHLHFQDSETLQFIQTFDDDYVYKRYKVIE